MPPTKKALVLSGGGARGAYHVGVFEALVDQGWMHDGVGPDIIAGTSIGAINAAALASGLTVAEIKRRWLAMHTEDVHRLSSDLPPVVHPLLRFLLHGVLTSETQNQIEATLPDEPQLSNRAFLGRLGNLFRTRPFRSLLDTMPWRHTLRSWMNFERINGPDAPALLLTATDVQTGALRIFCNRVLNNQPAETLAMDHLLASSSIPVVYPWTTIGTEHYWDGAVIANTPLEPVIDLAGGADVDILVVMMTPWHAAPADLRTQTRPMPDDLAQALALTLDWALLASYRVAFAMLQDRNQLADAVARLDRAADVTGDESMRMTNRGVRPITLPTVIAPEDLMPLEWMVDYEEANHQALFALGYRDALRALERRG